MTTTEDKIIAALNRLDDGQDVDSVGSVLADMLRKQSLFLRLFPIVGILAFLAVGVFSVVRFFTADGVQEWIGYATLFLSALICISLIKLWLYLVWMRNSLMREIKRMELRLLAAGAPRRQA